MHIASGKIWHMIGQWPGNPLIAFPTIANRPNIAMVRARPSCIYKPAPDLLDSLPLWPFGLDQV
ncbi:hypothetical protein P691DRAFT_137097 [Macrolepiota fuliginosa MF-IS2]|uniref:Uncharacterized protein n=1 Tax=Macrolepiota fuliginosa MF-IS2 TaxID=1400762 RepID=A0A9P5X9A9_9AGAR|nr:hypothetical protein P691DRAFT_137097 [Macrolepiota fuliginosa MF-IS2]